jgi:hypothetical protein
VYPPPIEGRAPTAVNAVFTGLDARQWAVFMELLREGINAVSSFADADATFFCIHHLREQNAACRLLYLEGKAWEHSREHSRCHRMMRDATHGIRHWQRETGDPTGRPLAAARRLLLAATPARASDGPSASRQPRMQQSHKPGRQQHASSAAATGWMCADVRLHPRASERWKSPFCSTDVQQKTFMNLQLPAQRAESQGVDWKSCTL